MLQVFDERNRDLIVNVGGRLSHRDRAAVNPFDSVVQGGDAVWEGLRLYRRKIFRLDDHLARLRAGARALAFEAIPSDEEITEQIRRTLDANGMQDGVHIRLTLTRGVKITSGMDPRLNQAGPTLIVLAEYKDPVYDPAGITLITASVRRRRGHARQPGLHRGDQRDARFHGDRRDAGDADHGVVPGGHHQGRRPRACRLGGHRLPDR
jgi:branched-chain amino acid aminotransferase